MNFLRPGQGINLMSWTAGLYLLVGVVVTYAGFHFATTRVPCSQANSDKTKSGGGVRVEQTNCEKTKQDTDIDIVAIHGLDTRSPDTWTWKDPNDTKNGERVNWLKHPDMLPKDVPRARIFTCDWPAAIFQPTDLVQKRIEEHGQCLLEALQLSPLAVEDSGRPLFFIASCLGGIILLEALMMGSGKAQSIQKATKGIVFLATPFHGTSFQDVAVWAQPGLRAWAVRQQKQVNHLLGAYAKGSTFSVEKRVRDFTAFCINGDNPCKVATFYEKGKTSLLRRAFPFLPGWLCTGKQLVDESSATLQIVPNPIPLDRPHILMNKFKGAECEEYKLVAGKIANLVTEICDRTPLALADDWISRKHYTEDRLKIERLSGNKLSMDRCYINLAIVEQPRNDTTCPEEGSKKRDMLPAAPKFSILSRLKIEVPDKNSRVELPTLFQERKGTDGHAVQPRRIRIRGRAGVGKTTLCKKMVYDFARGAWKDLFDRILWVPLRNLKTIEDEPCDFGELLYREYFHRNSNPDELVRKLWNTLTATEGNRTLFILDGLDEVAQDLSRNPKKMEFLIDLLNQPNVVITSRPYGYLPAGIKPLDLDLETIGFYPHQVKNYIENAVDNRQNANEIQSFLQHRLLIQDLVRIPILLDALCFTWEESFKHDPIQQTMTGMYQAIEFRLWKKDILRLKKMDRGQELTREQIENATRKQTESFVKDEISFLEHLAFTVLHNDLIDFELKHIHVILNCFTPRLLPDKALPSLSFLRSSDSSAQESNQNHHFIHLTFQEYFAARYFVRHWTSQNELDCLDLSNKKLSNEKPEQIGPATFLQKHKYDTRYNIFWRFVAGLLDVNHDEEQLRRFFDTVEEEPRDLLGPTHQRLVMHCLSEVVLQKETAFSQKLEETILHWVLFEHDLTRRSLLARQSERPESVTLGCLKSKRGRAQMLDTLQHSHAHMSNEVIKAIVDLLKDSNVRSAATDTLKAQSRLPQVVTAVVELLDNEDSNIRLTAAKILGGQSKLPQDAVTALMGLLKDEDCDVRLTAAYTLGAQSQLPQNAITTVVELLENEDSNVRSKAAGILKGQSQLPQEAATALVTLLKDKDGDVRSTTADTLKGQSQLPQEAVTALVELLENEDSNVRSKAAYILGAQSRLPQKTVTALVTLLKDKDGDVRSTTADTLKGQSQLPQEAVTALVELLENEDSNVRSKAAGILGTQPQLPKEAVTALMAALFNDENSDVKTNQSRAISVLMTRLRLSNRLSNIAFEALGLIESEESSGHGSFFNTQYAESLYGIWLQQSFAEHLSLYIGNGGGACIINRRNGLRTAYFHVENQYHQFLEALQKGRQVCTDRRQDLWGTDVVNMAGA